MLLFRLEVRFRLLSLHLRRGRDCGSVRSRIPLLISLTCAVVILAVFYLGSTSHHVASSGFQLSLSLPGAVYPRGALVPATIRVRNTGQAPLVLAPGCNPFVQELNRSGGTVLPNPAWIDQCSGGSSTLPAGRSRIIREYVLLASGRLRPAIRLHGTPTPASGVVTAIRLVAGRTPRYILHPWPRPYAIIQSPSARHGPLLYQASSSCRQPGTAFSSGTGGWLEAQGNQIGPQWDPSCTSSWTWSVVAGWLGQPAVQFSYRHG